jgi:hypothetical protein
VFDAEHSPQAPLPRQTGDVDGQSASTAHALHAFVAAAQVGVVPEQFELTRHWTHFLGDAVVRQYGFVPPQSESCEHPSIVTGVGGAPGPPPFPSEM